MKRTEPGASERKFESMGREREREEMEQTSRASEV